MTQFTRFAGLVLAVATLGAPLVAQAQQTRTIEVPANKKWQHAATGRVDRRILAAGENGAIAARIHRMPPPSPRSAGKSRCRGGRRDRRLVLTDATGGRLVSADTRCVARGTTADTRRPDPRGSDLGTTDGPVVDDLLVGG